MENTQYASNDIAIGKARPRRPTSARRARSWTRSTRAARRVLTLPGVFASPGGVPIMVDGKVIGAVGVSGVTGDQDEQCAKAGASGM